MQWELICVDDGDAGSHRRGILCLIASVQSLTTGAVAALLARTFFESSGGPAYLLADDRGLSDAWCRLEKHAAR